jgi:DNA-directed RNA polymerase subunit RPC12/RpoP
MKTKKLKIKTDYYLECPDCGGTMFLENVFESVIHSEVGQLWKCKTCLKEYHLTLKEYKQKELK